MGLGFRVYVMLASRAGNLRWLPFCSPRLGEQKVDRRRLPTLRRMDKQDCKAMAEASSEQLEGSEGSGTLNPKP